MQASRRFVPLALLAALHLLASPAQAIERHVGPGQPYATISAAVDAALAGDIITAHDYGGTPDYREIIELDVAGVTLREAPGENVSIQSVDAWSDVIRVLAGHVTVENLDIFGVDDGSGYSSAIGIHVDGADHCVIQGNRCGWGPGYRLLWGMYLRNDADSNRIVDNVCVSNREEGIYLHGSNNNLIRGNTCGNSRNWYHTEAGIRLYASMRNSLIGNTCEGSPVGMELVTNCGDNTIAGNLCSNNLYYGIYLYQNGYNVIVGNTASGNNSGIYTWNDAYSVIAGNTLSGNREYGLYLLSYYSHCYQNDFSGNVLRNVYHHAASSSNAWRPRVSDSYSYEGTARKGYLGNWYDDYAGMDADGDGIGDTPYAGIGFTDEHPLVAQRDNYVLRTWFLNDPGMMGNDMERAHGDRAIPPGGQLVWVADQPAASAMTFPAGTPADSTNWTYQLTVAEIWQSPSLYLTLTLGYANADGSGFTAVGGQPSTHPEPMADDCFSGAFDVAQEFTVPAGMYLAFRISNAHASYRYTVYGGGNWSYVSASWPSPAYPTAGEEPTSVETAGDPGVPAHRSWSARPNPFTTDVGLVCERPAGQITLAIHDVTGRLVRRLVVAAGEARLVWDGRDAAGRSTGAGIYYCRVEGAGAAVAPLKLVRAR